MLEPVGTYPVVNPSEGFLLDWIVTTIHMVIKSVQFFLLVYAFQSQPIYKSVYGYFCKPLSNGNSWRTLINSQYFKHLIITLPNVGTVITILYSAFSFPYYYKKHFIKKKLQIDLENPIYIQASYSSTSEQAFTTGISSIKPFDAKQSMHVNRTLVLV